MEADLHRSENMEPPFPPRLILPDFPIPSPVPTGEANKEDPARSLLGKIEVSGIT